MNTKKYEELLVLLRSHKTDKEILEVLSDYHENDIADMLAGMNEKERKRLYRLLGTQRTAEIFAYLDEPQAYFDELSVEQAARVVSLMDSDDAVDLLENLEDEDKKEIVEHLDEEAEKDVRMLLSYDDDEIGSYMTTNYICIPGGLTVKQAMSQLVRQAGENDNIMTIYVVDSDECFAGAIDLKDLITAREGMNLESIIAHSYPYVLDHEKIDDCIDTIKDYAEDSIPVLSKDKHILGVITSDDIVEMVDNEMGEDYAKLAGLTAEEDLKETTLQSMKKRMPWLIILLFLGMIVSSVVGIFENVVAALPIVICFQSLVLDMAGNVGTQSLAVTIRVLMDENLSGKQKLLLVVKEVRIDSVVVKRQYEDRYHVVKAKMPCLITALSELNEPRYMTPGGIFDAFDKEVTVWGRADLKDVDDSDLGLKGSPTKIAKASDKVPKGAGEKVNLDPTESVNYLMEKFKEKHII
mgnify:CR=1 FL=1